MLLIIFIPREWAIKLKLPNIIDLNEEGTEVKIVSGYIITDNNHITSESKRWFGI